MTKPTKKSYTHTDEFENVPSDRMELIEEANRLVECLAMKPIIPKGINGYTETIELTEPEQEAYHSALKFLSQQFFNGPRDPDLIASKLHREESLEWPDPEPPKEEAEESVTFVDVGEDFAETLPFYHEGYGAVLRHTEKAQVVGTAKELFTGLVIVAKHGDEWIAVRAVKPNGKMDRWVKDLLDEHGLGNEADAKTDPNS